MTRARWRFTLNTRVRDDLQVGVEFNAAAEELNPLVTWFPLTETPGRPSLFLGTSSDRIGSPPGATAVYATLGKTLTALGFSVYASLNWSEWEETVTVPFGGALDLCGRAAARYMYDGRESHALLDLYADGVGVSLMWIWLERFGVALHGGF